MNESENRPAVGFLGQQSETDAEGKARPFIIQQLDVRPLNRKSYDIHDMLRAIRSAESTIPRRLELYDMYEDFISTDAHLRSVYDKRIMGVTNKDWQYHDANGQEVPFMTEWIDSPEFELVIAETLKSKLWGYTVLEFNFYPDGTFGVWVAPRKHLRPSKGIVAFQQSGDNGINIREAAYADTIMEVGDEKDLGLLMVAAAYVIFKRDGLSDYAQFAEVFGQPWVDAIWDGYDENQRQELLKAIDAMGSGGRIVRPQGTTLEFKSGGVNNPNGQIYATLIDICNKEISKCLIGQTETTESSGSSGYAQASVHAGTENDINAMDTKFVRRVLNRRLHMILEANGKVQPGGKFSIKNEGEEYVNKKERLAMEISMKNDLGLPIDDDHFYENYGVEKPANYEAEKARIAAEKAAQQISGPQFQMALRETLLKMRDEGFF